MYSLYRGPINKGVERYITADFLNLGTWCRIPFARRPGREMSIATAPYKNNARSPIGEQALPNDNSSVVRTWGPAPTGSQLMRPILSAAHLRLARLARCL